MTKKFLLDDIEYSTDKLGENGLKQLSMVSFIIEHITEVQNKQKVLMLASATYKKSLKNEILRSKAGLLLEDD